MSASTQSHGRLAGVAAALFAVTIWAGWIPVTRLGVVTRLTPGDVAALRYGTSGLLLLPLLLIRAREVPWRRVFVLAAMILGAGVPYFFVFATGLRMANSGQGGVLGPGAAGVFTVLIAALLLGERPSRVQVAGISITVAGIALVVLRELYAGGARAGGFLLILCAALAWASFSVAARTLRLRPVVTTAVISVVNAALYLPLYFATGGLQRLALVPVHDIALQVIYQGVLTGILALVAFTFAIERLGAAGAASFTPLSPVLVAFTGWLILGDTIDATTATGLAAVSIGVLVANRGYAWFTARR
ncbi:MAG: DMT family transporter [Proteobacteria bacterium]|nr:DMT family transporter [Pseudomonadota bacterium]